MSAIVKLWWWQLANNVRQACANPANLVLLIPIVWLFGTAWLISMIPGPQQQTVGQAETTAQAEALLFLGLCAMSSLMVGIGFLDNVLVFNASDFAYLFPAPISSRTIVAARLPRIVINALIWSLWVRVAAGKLIAELVGHSHTDAHASMMIAVVIFFLCGYGNVAVVLEINRRKSRLDGWLYLALMIAVSAWIGLHAKSAGDAANIGWLRVLFAPCRVAAQTLVGIVLGHDVLRGLVMLGIFYVATLALIFAREVNFSERSLAIRDRQQANCDAVKAGALFGPETLGKHRAIRSRDYTVPPFGTGTWALLWANCSAALKNPWVRIATPLACGFGLGYLTTFLGSDDAARSFRETGIYTTFAAVFLAQMGFLIARTRGSVIRPLPLDGWQVIVAETVPPAAMMILFQWGMAASLFNLPGDAQRGLLLFELLACLPIAGFCMMVITYGASAWIVAAPDAAQGFIATAAGPIAVAMYAFLVAGLMAIPQILTAPAWVPLAVAFVFCLASAPGLIALAGYIYSEIRPEGVVAISQRARSEARAASLPL